MLRRFVPRAGLLLVIVASAAGCARETGPNTTNLVASFAEQIAAIEFVEDFRREGDEITFARVDGAGDRIEWRVVIDETSIDEPDDETEPLRGIVRSSWSANGDPIRPSGNISGLPMWILETGLSQDCWALWEAETATWSWL